MFGTKNKVSLKSFSLPLEVIERLQSEEDLLAVFLSDGECASRKVDEHEIDDVMNTQPIQKAPPSPPVLTPVQPGLDETLTEVPELTPAPSPLGQKQYLIQTQ